VQFFSSEEDSRSFLPTRAARDATKREHCGGILSECLSFDAGSRRVGLAKSWLTALARTCSFEEVGRSVPPIWPGELYLLFPLFAEVVCRNGATCGSKTGAAIFAVTRFAAKYSAAKYLCHVSGREPTGFELCASVWTSQTPTLVPTANTRRDFLFAGAACCCAARAWCPPRRAGLRPNSKTELAVFMLRQGCNTRRRMSLKHSRSWGVAGTPQRGDQ
jgi:hypothetical protein